MLALIILAWIFGSIAAYVGIGYLCVRWDTPRIWAYARANNDNRYVHDSVIAQTVCMMLFWPLLAPFYAIASPTMRYVNSHDPVVLAKQLQEKNNELERDIQRLEHELEIPHIGGQHDNSRRTRGNWK